MKKNWNTRATAGLLAAFLLTAASVPVGAAELSDTNPTGEMEVNGEVVDETETASYLISVPAAMDFGKLKKPATAASSPVSRDLQVECTQYNLSNTSQAVAVLLKDKDSADRKFYLTGTGTANAGKTLQYSVLSGSTNIEERTVNSSGGAYIENLNGQSGYLYCAFQGTGAKNGTLTLDQNQLYDKDLAAYAGQYSGTVTFVTTVIKASDYMSVLQQ